MFHNIAVPVESKEQNLLSDNGINFNTGLLLWEYKVDINWHIISLRYQEF